MIHEMCGIRRLTVSAKCSILAPETSIRQLDVVSGTDPLSRQDSNKQYVNKVLDGQIYLVQFQPGQNQDLVKLAEKTIDFIYSLEPNPRMRQLILFSGATKSFLKIISDLDPEDSDVFVDLALDFDSNTKSRSGEKLAAL